MSRQKRVAGAEPEIVDILDLGGGITVARLQWPMRLRHIGRERFFGCCFYDDCLCHAGKHKWQSFSCRLCSIWQNFKKERREAKKKVQATT